MSQALNNLLTLLNLGKNRRRAFSRTERRFRLTPVFWGAGSWGKRYMPLRRQFRQTVWCTHSTATFLRPGDSAKPIVYDVEVLRDGQSFSARRVAAIQHGKPIFYMTASFRGRQSRAMNIKKRCRLPRRRMI